MLEKDCGHGTICQRKSNLDIPTTPVRKHPIGINAVILNNVNADPRILGHDYLEKVAALADIFRKYHIKVYLAPNFAAPVKPSTTKDVGKQWGGVGIGHLDTADPLNPEVQKWWMDKVNEIYSLIPDFWRFPCKSQL